jgi:hypothetical protein
MIGFVVSTTVILLVHVELFAQSSVAVQVLVVVYVPTQLPFTVLSVNVIVTVASHASVAVASTHTGVAGQLIGVVCA